MDKIGQGWGNTDEIKFIDRLGEHSLRGKAGVVSLKALLAGYLEGCKKRRYWGKLNKKSIIEYATKILREL